MEYTNEIFFNKKLIKNETVIITYSGKLYREHSGEIYIVYGYGEDWHYTEENKMNEIENGFEVEIKLKNYDTFNFCFRNNYNIWDNNCGFNYISPIEEIKNSEEDSITENSQNLENQNDNNQNTQNEIIKEEKNIGIEIVENAIKEINTKINETVTQTSKNSDNFDYENNSNEIISNEDKIKEFTQNTDNVSNSEFEKMLDELLDSILQFNETENNINFDINLENGFGLQSIDEIKEIDITDFDDNIFNDIYENENSNNSELENLLNDFSEKSEENIDNLINNENNFQISELPTLKKDSSDDFFDRFIDKSYDFFKNVWNGCKKIGSLLKRKAKNLLSEEK